MKETYWYSFLSIRAMPPMKSAPKMDMPMQNIVPEERYKNISLVAHKACLIPLTLT